MLGYGLGNFRVVPGIAIVALQQGHGTDVTDALSIVSVESLE